MYFKQAFIYDRTKKKIFVSRQNYSYNILFPSTNLLEKKFGVEKFLFFFSSYFWNLYKFCKRETSFFTHICDIICINCHWF